MNEIDRLRADYEELARAVVLHVQRIAELEALVRSQAELLARRPETPP